MSVPSKPQNPINVPAPLGASGEECSLPSRIRQLLADQPYAILCTQSQSEPYASLVAFAASKNLKKLVFSTPVATRKYRLLTECEHVALLIDSRSASPADVMRIEAVTVTGSARVVAPGTEFDSLASLLTTRHPQLAAFVRAQSSALVCVEVDRYFHVCHFQEVCQWAPGSAS
jgi:nitroimidazol reductase NimA-like FMN-containing flavoprotein (pyridoxamine 5'-phosphate oxidase superfamily)